MSPVLILARVPTSRTGVLPEIFLSSSGPNRGRLRPNRVVSPRMNRETTKRKRSTSWMGSHLSKNMDSPKVEVPNISRGRTCTFISFKKINIISKYCSYIIRMRKSYYIY